MPLILLCLLGLVAGCDKKVVRSVDVPVEDAFVEEALTEDVLANGGLVCSGSLHLPTGAGMLAEELQVISFFGAAKPSAAGAFTISMADSKSPQFVFATDPATDNSLLLGYVNPLQSEHVNLSCESTAVGLAFLSPLMIGTTAEQRSEFISEIKAHPNFPLLVEAVESAFQADPQNMLDGTVHPELYQQAADISVNVWQQMTAAGKLLAPEAAQQNVCNEDRKANVWLKDEKVDDSIVFCNPKTVYYVSSISKGQGNESLVHIGPKKGAISLKWKFWDFGTPPEPTYHNLTENGGFNYDIYKGYNFLSIPDVSEIFDWNTAYGRASMLNIGQGVVHIIDLFTGIIFIVPSGPLENIPGFREALGETKENMNAIDSMINFARFIANHGETIATWIIQANLNSERPSEALHTYLTRFNTTILANIAAPLAVAIRGYKLSNTVLPFFTDLLFAEAELKYGEFTHSSNSFIHKIKAGDSEAIVKEQEGRATYTATLSGEEMESVEIKEGTFIMGSAEGADETPHDVDISLAHYRFLGKYEVTQGQWKAVMGTTPWAGKSQVVDDPSHPAVYISWDDVQEFIARLNAVKKEEGRSLEYRLPTEAEWEYACRAGTQTKWSFGDEEGQLTDYAWHDVEGEFYAGAMQVGQKMPNPWWLYDMHGNVAEWVQDWYADDYYNNSPRENPQGPKIGTERVYRGGSFLKSADDVRSAARFSAKPELFGPNVGFRLLVDHAEKWDTFTVHEDVSMPMVKVNDFWLGKYEVTQGQWEAVMGTTPWDEHGVPSHPWYPAVYISWNGVQAFINRLNERERAQRYRLPTEAEWEYACRAGTQTKWSFGSNEERLKNYAWYNENTEEYQRVGWKGANPWGLHDMHGNVWEWVQDRDEGDDSKRVGRGGSFKSDAQSVDSDHHSSADPDTRNDQVGFRLLRDGEATGSFRLWEETVPLLGDAKMTVVFVEPGVFQMGEPNGQHEVEISKEFWLGKHEVTQGQWEAVMGTTPWDGKANVQLDPSYPATYISWEDVQRFIARLNEEQGDEWEWRYRLPTEAEWEYVCRARTPTEWSFGDDESDLEYYAWYNANTKEYPQMVYWKRANPWGLYDMHGNVAEWVQDWYDPSSPDEDPRKRVTRGGAFNGSYEDTRSASRSAEYPDIGNAYTGVRLVLYKTENPEEPAAAPREETFELLGGAEMAMMWIEPGVFQFRMGAPSGQHEVEISEGFWLGTYEVTQRQWEAVMGMTDWSEPWVGQDSVQSHESRPAVYISWEDVQEFIARLNEAAGERRYRLPTEAEWEYACRAGTQTDWSFGNEEEQLEHYAWYGDYTAAQEVGLKRANPWGLHDMHGNVREWVQDRRGSYGSYSYYEDPLRSVRGGAFNLDNPRSLRSLSTRGAWPDTRGANIGFRLVRDETPQEPLTRTVSLPEGPSMEMVWIDPGMFLMGSKEEDGQEIERPEHQVEISKGFWLGMYEVTQEQWEAVMETTPWSGVISSNPSYPAVKISWEDVRAFIDTLNVRAGERRYRLPSEAEWEYACRAGMPARWSFGDDERRLEHYAWYKENATSVKAVGQTRANAWGLYDMHGNVWEWVQDGCCRTYDSSPQVDPLGPDTDTGAGRIARGGGYANSADRLRSAHRSSFPHDTGEVSRGFRLLMLEEPEALPVEEPEEAPPASSELQTPEEARSALDEQGIDFTQASFFERVRAGDLSAVRLFIAAGMDITKVRDKFYRTAVMYAAEDGHVEVVRLLLEHGADINAPSKYGSTAWNFAAWGGHVEVVRLLLEHGADINAQNDDGTTALMSAASGGRVEVMRFLLEHGADINAQNDDGTTALMIVARNAQENHVEVMRFLLEHGADINAQDNRGRTALMYPYTDFLRQNSVEVMRFLLEHGANINAQDNDGYTALMRASGGDVEGVRLLLEHGADIHAQNNNGDTALMRAASGGDVEVMRLLLEHGADINAQNNNGDTAWSLAKGEVVRFLNLRVAAREGDVEVMRLLLEHGADINAQSFAGTTPLILAAWRGHVEVVRLLLEHGADINVQDNDGETALMVAAEEGYVEVVRLLLEHGADINAQNNNGDTALSLAKYEGYQEVIDLLEALSVEDPEEASPASSEREARSALDEQGIDFTQYAFFERVKAGDVSAVRLFIAAGMDINAQNNRGDMALPYAAAWSHMELVRLLLEHGADTNAQDNRGRTALLFAADGGRVDMVRLLLEHGADTNAQDDDGDTALLHAARRGHMEVVRFLLEHGADTNAQNNDGDTALLYAARRGYVEVVRLLLEHGADTNAQNNDGDTALSLAKQRDHQEVIDLLEAAGATE